MVQKAWTMEALSAFRIDGNERILDVGCGDGAISELLSRKVPKGKVLAIDTSPSMIAYSKTTWERPNLQFDLQDIESAPYRGEFDLVTLFFTLQWLTNQNSSLQTCYESLAAGGRIWILAPTGMPEEMKKAGESTLMNPRWHERFETSAIQVPYFTEEEMARLLSKWFGALHVKKRKKEMLFSNRDAFHYTLRVCLPYIQGLAEDLKDLFLSDYIDAYLQIRPADSKGRVFVTLEVAQWVGTKTGELRQ